MVGEESTRIEAIWLRTVEKMKEVVREFRVTQDELHVAGDYFNRLGQAGMCRSLIDVALAMTSVEASGGADRGTRPNLQGPYHAAHPTRGDGRLFSRIPDPDQPRLTLRGQVRDADSGRPVPGASLDFWQADSNGIYDRAGDHLRGIICSDPDGSYELHTVVPNDYSEHDHDPIGELFRAMGKHNTRAAHIHLKASVGGRELLTTQIFMSLSKFLDKDYVEGAVSDDLTVELRPNPSGSGFVAEFDISLAGALA